MNTGIGRNLTEIALLLIAVAVIALLIGQAEKTAKVITAGAGAFGNLLNIVTLQGGGYSNLSF